ncbi:MAG: ACT domain-containing protein [Candidatus Hadarchaeota archaeon]
MLVKIVMELQDVPGQLLRALEPISRLGGNIHSIMHQRERKTPLGRIPVTLVFEVGDRARLNKMLAAIRAMGVTITQLGEGAGNVQTVVMLVGHIINTDARDTINRLNAVKGVRVSDLSLVVGGRGQESVARMTITANEEKNSRAAVSMLQKIANEKKLLLLTSLEALQ